MVLWGDGMPGRLPVEGGDDLPIRPNEFVEGVGLLPVRGPRREAIAGLPLHMGEPFVKGYQAFVAQTSHALQSLTLAAGYAVFGDVAQDALLCVGEISFHGADATADSGMFTTWQMNPRNRIP